MYLKCNDHEAVSHSYTSDSSHCFGFVLPPGMDFWERVQAPPEKARGKGLGTPRKRKGRARLPVYCIMPLILYMDTV